MITLQIVKNDDQLTQVRTLFQEYADTRKDDPALLSFPEEIRNLPGEYAPPDGGIILAYYNGEVAGCVAVHSLDHDVCEMKRLYVLPMFRGRGIGRHLVLAILKQAQMMGYLRMRLDSIPSMEAAQALYKSVGFYEIDAYRENPNEGTAYYEVELHHE
jgi:ribosomal protein S18 acetylase RimI-like enzyme